MVVLVQKWLYSDKSGCIREKFVVFGKNLLYLGKMVVIGQKWLYSDKSGFIQNDCLRAKLFFSGKLFVFGKIWF